ncbi:hypothetical protein [Acinetobacter pittii]
MDMEEYYLEFPDQNPENFDENGNLKEEVAVEIALKRSFLYLEEIAECKGFAKRTTRYFVKTQRG